MTTKVSEAQEITLVPGCQPGTDKTAFSTSHSTFSDKVRWFQGVPQKIGGWAHISFDYGAVVLGVCRRIFSAFLSLDANVITVLGTNANLYALIGTRLTNITPLNTTPITIANSLSSDFRTLGANPLSTVNGQSTVTISDPDTSQYLIGDTITLSGCTTVHGITNTMLNMEQIIRSINYLANTYTIQVGGNATGTGSGGGSSCVIATGLITVAATAHGQTNGQRTKITGAATFAGISSTLINAEFIVRNVHTNTFQIMTTGTATSSVTGGGGASTAYQTQLAAGAVDESASQGYGAGLYGVGLYGTALISPSGRTFPLIWCLDRFQAVMVMSPGNQQGIYTWDGNTDVAPVLLANAPTAINYVFISNDIVVTFGYQGVANQIFASDQANPTNWTASSANQVFQDTISGASALISHLPVNGVNLIFTNNQTYIFAYIGLPLVWSITTLSSTIGIIAPLARCTVNGVAYWMGLYNWYRWRGANIEVVPSNSQTVSTIFNYVYNNLTGGQRSKIYAWYNEKFGEIWFHYPSASSNEPDKVARVNINENFIWTPDTFDRTAAESPNVLAITPRLISSEGILYNHETGTDDDGSAMAFSLESNLRFAGKSSKYLSAVAPDSVQTGNILLTVEAMEYPQSAVATNTGVYTISPTSLLQPMNVGGRFWKYTWSGSVIGQQWIGGRWLEYIQEGSMQ